MSATLAPAREADIAVLARLHALCFPEEAWDSAALATILAMPGADGRVACAGSGEACGLVLDQCLGADAEILTLGVAPTRRRNGIARALLTDFFLRARAAGARRILLEVAADNEPGLALYHSLGFYRQGRRHGYYLRAARPAVDAWRLCLDLPPHAL